MRKIGAGELGLAQHRLEQPGIVEIGAREIGALGIDQVEIGGAKLCTLEIGAGQSGAEQARAREVRAREIGAIEPGPDTDSLLRVAADGSRDTRRSPIAQNRSKVAFLRGVLPGMWPVKGLGVFSSDQCSLSPALPLDLVRLCDLGHWFRAERTRYEAAAGIAVNVPEAWRAVLSVSEIDASGIALEAHRKRVGVNTEI